MPIVAVEARSPCAAHQLVFANPLQPVRVRPRDRTAHSFVQNLRQASRVQRVHQIFRGRPARRFAHPVAVAIVDQQKAAMLGHPILEIVDVCNAS